VRTPVPDDPSIRLAIRSDRRLFHDALAACLADRTDFAVVGHVTHGRDLFDLCRLRQPDIVLFDAGADISVTARLLTEVANRHPEIRLVVTYEQLTRAGITLAARLGIDSLVPHSHGLDALVATLQRNAEALRSRVSERTAADPGLTAQEREIITLLSAGHTADRVAELLNLSQSTVENSKRRIYQKMRVTSQSHAIARASALGLVDRSVAGPADRRSADRRAAPGTRPHEPGMRLRVMVLGPDTPTRHHLSMILLHCHIPFVINPDPAAVPDFADTSAEIDDLTLDAAGPDPAELDAAGPDPAEPDPAEPEPAGVDPDDAVDGAPVPTDCGALSVADAGDGASEAGRTRTARPRRAKTTDSAASTEAADSADDHGADEGTHEPDAPIWPGRAADPVVAVFADPEPAEWELISTIDLPVLLVRSRPMSRAAALAALARGVVGMIDADRLELDLIPALTLTSSGHLTISSTLADGVVAGIRARAGDPDAPLPQLTPRERDILNSIASGHTVRQTARALGIAQKTVENIQARLFRKLGVRNRAGAAAAAHSLGLLDPDAPERWRYSWSKS
jgi:DNA-binding NarL/FixJ family response regulator